MNKNTNRNKSLFGQETDDEEQLRRLEKFLFEQGVGADTEQGKIKQKEIGLGRYLYASRENTHMSVEQLSEVTGIPFDVLIEIEIGEYPIEYIEDEWLEAIADALKEDVDDLYLILGRLSFGTYKKEDKYRRENVHESTSEVTPTSSKDMFVEDWQSWLEKLKEHIHEIIDKKDNTMNISSDKLQVILELIEFRSQEKECRYQEINMNRGMVLIGQVLGERLPTNDNDEYFEICEALVRRKIAPTDLGNFLVGYCQVKPEKVKGLSARLALGAADGC